MPGRRNRVAAEFAHAYRATRTRQRPTLPPARPFRDFIFWLRSRDLVRAEAFWRRALEGFRFPTRLRAETPDVDSGRLAAAEQVDDEVVLTAALSERLRERGRECRVTLSTIVQGAWHKGYDDRLAGRITDELWSRKSGEWETELSSIRRETARHERASHDYASTGSKF